MRFFLLITSFCCFVWVNAQSYQAEGMLNVLGQIKDSSDVYKAFAKEWGLGRKTFLPEKGFKLSRNYETQRITALFFAGKGFEVGDTKFDKFEGKIPFGLTMDDDINALLAKLGTPKKGGEDYAKFSKNGLVILAKFRNKARTKLEYIKISLAFGQLTYSPDYVEEEESEEVASITQPIIETPSVKNATPAKVSNREKIGLSRNYASRFFMLPPLVE
jgi:hypothetical protein